MATNIRIPCKEEEEDCCMIGFLSSVIIGNTAADADADNGAWFSSKCKQTKMDSDAEMTHPQRKATTMTIRETVRFLFSEVPCFRIEDLVIILYGLPTNER
jgi:hypothetical protein